MSHLGDKAVDEFLNAQTQQGTFKSYKTVLKQYLEYSQKTGQQLLDIKRNDKDFQVENSMLTYRKHILSKGKSENYAVGSVMTIRGFYSYYRLPLMFRRNDSRKLTEKSRTTTDYLFDKEDLAKMSLAGDLKERYVLLVGKSVGLRAGDFVKLTFGQFRSLKLDGEAPIAFGEIGTGKEKVKAYPFLDSDAVPIVKAWLESHKDAKDTELMAVNSESNLTIILQTLCQKAGMEIENGSIHGKRVRFHCLRKFLIDRLSAYAGESQWKQVVGKAIGEGAYVSQDQLRGVYARAMKDLVINGNGLKVKKLVELENALVDSQKRLTNLEVTNDVLRKELSNVSGLKNEFECLATKFDKTQKKNEELESDLRTATSTLRDLRPLIENIDEISELLKVRREEKEAQARVERDEIERRMQDVARTKQE